MNKYKITAIEHPQYPWLHRIQALIDVNEKVPKGTIGGFVDSITNLSQGGGCWIYDDAICCEGGLVREEAEIYDDSMVRGTAVVAGKARIYNHAVAKDSCYISSGEIKDDAVIAGKAIIGSLCLQKPLISGDSRVYGRTDRTCDHLQITAYQSGADNIRKDYQRKFRNLSVVSTGKKEMTTGYVRGEVTVYLTLTFILLVSLVLALTESASIQMAKNYRRADMNRAVECVFAEYQKELLEHYDVFAIEAGYESGTYSEQNLLDRLSYYGADMENDIKRIRLFTDQNGELFMDQAGKYMKHKYGISWADKYLGSTSIWKNQERQADEITREEKVQTDHLEELLNGQEMELPGEENPLEHVAGLKQAPILSLVLPKETQVSEKQIVSEDMPENRENQTGHGTFEDVESEGGTLDSVLLGGYIQEHFADFLDEPKGGSLDYEVEYILAGRQSDRENLETVANKLVLLRFVPNYLYLQTNSTRQAEARAAAGTLCTLLAVPAVTEAATQGILLAWAYGESVMDVRTLLNGKKTAVVKDDASWQLSLSGLMKLGTEEDTGDGADVEGGMDYKDYVRMLLFLEDKGKLTVRTMGVIEKDMQTIYSQPSFRIDYCVGRMEVDTVCKLRRGISYRFQTYYGYQ